MIAKTAYPDLFADISIDHALEMLAEEAAGSVPAGIFYYNGNAYCKKLLCNKKGTYLISLNDKYDPIEIAEGETFKTFGRVVS